jgi:hypothetical protein
VTADERNEEGAGEPIEDLQAPAAAQEDVAGGSKSLCGNPSLDCSSATCAMTEAYCTEKTATHHVVVFEQ